VLAAREAQLAGVTASARGQAEAARRALAESQAQVERLEGLAVALREGVGAAGAAAALAELPRARRKELVGRFQELRAQLESAQVGGAVGAGGDSGSPSTSWEGVWRCWVWGAGGACSQAGGRPDSA
jgi:hypothetical protein